MLPPMRPLALLLPLLALVTLPAGAHADGRVVDRVLATVDAEVVTLSRLEFESRVQLVSRGGTEASLAALPGDVLAQNLAFAISQRLAAAEAAKLGVFDVDPTEIDAATTEFRSALGTVSLEQFLALNELTLGELQRLFRRDLQAGKYLTSRAQLRAPVDDADVNALLALHPELADRPSRALREELRARLTRERTEAQVQAELQRLFARAKVRIVDPGFVGADHALKPQPSGSAVEGGHG
jgi:hypothetical protein